MLTIPPYTIKFLGDGGVGKTAWITKMRQEFFQRKYIATVGSVLYPSSFRTNYGDIQLNFWDYAGQEKYGADRPTQAADASILLFDLTNKVSYKHLAFWHAKCGSEPVFVVGNKSDIVDSRMVDSPSYHALPYWEVSAKTMTAAELLTPILRQLTGHEDLVIQ